MCRPRLRGRGFWLGLLGAPCSVWVLLVLLTPTGWVKARLTARLQAETGRVVEIGSVRLGWCGGLKIVDLRLAEPSCPADPWLRVAETAINVHPVRVLLGCCQPSAVTLRGAEVRIWRQADGWFEFGDLVRRGPSNGSRTHGGTGATDALAPIHLQVEDSTVRVIDDHDDLRFNLHGIAAEATWEPNTVELSRLVGQINGGTFQLAARLARDPVSPHFAAEIRAKKIRLDAGLNLVETYVPLVARSETQVGGRLNAHLAVQGRGATSCEIRETLAGHGSLLLDPIDLDGSRILTELKVLGEWPDEAHIGAVSSNFTVERGRINTDDLTIRAARLPLVVAGWTDFDGQFDYATRVDRILADLPRDARNVLKDVQGSFDELAGLRIAGTRDKATLTLNGRPLATDLAPTNSERVRFRETARKIRDRFFR